VDDPVASEIWVCQGPPRCALEGAEAVRAQQNGCVWCKVIHVMRDGTTVVARQPHEA